ncbi:MAG: hypothetical protein ABIM89_17035 [Mycobacteriales bacterium]
MTTDIPGEHDTTSGSDTRDSRALRAPLSRFALLDEIGQLAGEPEWNTADRNSIVLAKDARFRMMLTVLRRGARLADDDGQATFSLQLVTGSVTVTRGGEELLLAPGEIAVVEAGASWSVEAAEESAVLMTLAWPEASAP